MAHPSIAADDVRRILPRPVGIGIRHAGDGDLPPLLPQEEQALGSRVVQRRHRHYALGRAAARDALAEIGVEPVAIGRGPEREPLWPSGIVGTISHSGDLALAIVGRQTDYTGLGVDVEQLSPGVSARAMRLVCTPAERAWLACWPETWRTRLFSAKEAVFKALFPIERVWLGFGDAELTFDPATDAFEARLLKRAGMDWPIGSVLPVHSALGDTAVLSVTYAQASPADVDRPVRG